MFVLIFYRNIVIHAREPASIVEHCRVIPYTFGRLGRFRTTIGAIKKKIHRGQSGPDRDDWKKQSLVKYNHRRTHIALVTR